jgi:hypothetical protein
MSALLSYALCSLFDVKESMGIASSDQSWDNLIIRKINQATRQIEAYCDRRFALTTYTEEIYGGSDTNQIILRNRPIVGSVTLGVRQTFLNEGDFEDLDSNLIFADNNSGVLDLNFTAVGNWGRYRVTYQAGYATIPEDLAEACATLAAFYALNSDGSQIGLVEKQEGSRKIRYGSNPKDFAAIMSELGIDQIINSYSNLPLLADR